MATIIDSNGTPTSESSALSVIDVTLDIRQNRMVSVLLKQYNKQSQQIKFTVTDNGEKIELKEIEHTVLFKMMTPDGRRISSYCAINENDHTAVLTVAKNYCSYPGKGTAELEVMNALEESQIGTMNLDVIIENSVYPDEMINGSSTYQGLDEKINAVREVCNSAIIVKEETESIRDETETIHDECVDLNNQTAQNTQLANDYANMAQSYANGESGAREGEETDNAKYYYNQTSLLKTDTETIKTELLEVQEVVNQKASAAESYATNASNSATEAENSASQTSIDRETVTALANEVNNKIGSPLTASTSSDMINQNKIYVYTGSEDGYTFGNWYYYDGSSWVSGGIYNSTAFETDSELIYAGQAADAKATGDKLSELKDDIVNVEQSVNTYESCRIYASDMKSGTIDKDTGVESQSSNVIISNEFIDISKVKSFKYTGIASADYYVRVVYYDNNKAFLSGTNGVLANSASVDFDKPNDATCMKLVIAYLSISDISYIKPTIDFLTFIDGDAINRSVKKGKFKTFQNDWEILEGKWVDIPSGQTLKRTDSRNSCTANFLHAKRGNELILQSPISFSIMLFSEADETTCFYNSYKDGIFYSGYKFNSDCYFLLNFTNQQDMSAETKKSDIVWTKNTVKDVQTVFIVPNAEYSTIHVASAWASDAEKLGADYVCDGINDGEELQQAIFDLRARGGGVLKLSNERYIIDTLFDSGIPSVGKYGIYIPTNNYNVSLIKIEGVNFPNVIQPMYFGHCARLDMSQELYDSLGDNEIVSMIGVKPVIGKENEATRSSVGCTLSVENVAINIPAPQKKIIGVNCEYAYNMQLKGVHCGLTEFAGDPQTPNGKIINSVIDCIGIRTLYGYNWGSGYHIDDCNVRGWGIGFDISGEHLIMQNACARFVNTGFRFGHFGDDEMMSHPNTLINCCEEWLLHGMVFEGNGLGQSVNIIDFNIEDMTSNGWGRKTLATESVKGAYKGTLTYTTTKDSYKNSQEKFWADDGSGKNIITRDLNDKFSGITSERPKYPQNNQQYFDTTVNKMLYFINGKWVDAMGTVIE